MMSEPAGNDPAPTSPRDPSAAGDPNATASIPDETPSRYHQELRPVQSAPAPSSSSSREERRKRSSFGKMDVLERVPDRGAADQPLERMTMAWNEEGRERFDGALSGGGAGAVVGNQSGGAGDDLDAEYVRLKLALADARSRSDEQRLTLHKLTSEISTLKSELGVARDKVKDLKSAAEETSEATEQLKLYADEAAEERDRLRQAADRIAAERDGLQKRLEGLTHGNGGNVAGDATSGSGESNRLGLNDEVSADSGNSHGEQTTERGRW
eukprot:CAMPEP_0183293616 /NCGR_PEP_ID=MMETSP0160_2-20130417/2234_1 /TAXON_ID=2839 ORGANISM="Odontella Sinensis, Strain Grunow 1884" /NCGR_SAMPLE_ID=MMETSP0160_2 /ASSEMBLY_ACC=CAM_ASM_000250 /LENGTH=268 /DNA_ID=CAMNT_0025454761 /DNA_START=25 /DNA_END=831 /DNA_ORIENTATION=+